jgi:hypothetical protein
MAGPDMTPFIQHIAIGGVVIAVVSIAAAVAVVLIARSGSMQGLRMLMGKIEVRENENRYRKRYEREQKNAAYKSWKKGKGY